MFAFALLDRTTRSAGSCMKAAVIAAGLLMTAVPAWAIDGSALVEHYIELAEESGIIIAYDTLEETGEDSFVLHNLSIQGPKMPDPVRVHKVSIRGARDEGGNGFSADAVTLSGLNFSTVTKDRTEMTVTVDSGDWSGIYFPDPANLTAPLIAYDRSTAKIGNIRMLIDGSEALSVDAVSGEAMLDKKTNTYRTTAEIGLIRFHTENITDPEAKAKFEALGIDTIKLSVDFGASWNMDSGRLEITEYTFDAPDLGRLAMGLAIDGYTSKVATDLRNALAEQNAADPDDHDAQKAATRKIIDMFGRLKFVSGKISYTDDSLAGLVLDLQAKSMGGSRKDFVDNALAMLGGVTQALDNPEFSGMLSEAVRTFLSAPENFHIVLEPGAPVAVSDIFGAVVMSPGTLIEKLGVRIVANE